MKNVKVLLRAKASRTPMELDEKTLDGQWSENLKTGLDLFIINDAIFFKIMYIR